MKERFTKLCEETHGNQGKVWSPISPYNVNTGRIILKDNGKIIKEQNEVAETLNAYFTGFDANSAGCDLIPPRLVQRSAEVLSKPFSTLFLDHTTVP